MITNNSEFLDHLPYTDIPISSAERASVEDLIRVELSHNQNYRDSIRANSPQLPNQLPLQHPMVEELVPLPEMPSPNSLTLQAIERYENEEVSGDEGDEDGKHIITGIDTTRYLGYGDAQSTAGGENTRYYESLYYHLNEASNLSLVSQNIDDFADLNRQYMEDIQKVKDQAHTALEKKRKRIEEVNMMRNKRQNDFKPVDEYLHARWRDGIKTVVDLSVETIKNKEE